MRHEWKRTMIKMYGRTMANGKTRGTGRNRKINPREGYECEHCHLTALPPLGKKAVGFIPPAGNCIL